MWSYIRECAKWCLFEFSWPHAWLCDRTHWVQLPCHHWQCVSPTSPTLWLPLTLRPRPHQPPGPDPSPVKQTGHLKVPPMPSKLCSIRWHRSLAGESNIWLHSLHSWLMPSSATQDDDTTGYTHWRGQIERIRYRETQTHAAKRQGTTFLHINRLRGRLISERSTPFLDLSSERGHFSVSFCPCTSFVVPGL